MSVSLITLVCAVIIIGVLFVVVPFVALFCFMAAPVKWQPVAHWGLVMSAALVAMLITLKLLTSVLITLNEVSLYFVLFPPVYDACGFQMCPPEKQAEIQQQTDFVKQRFDSWLATPPWSRPSCESVSANLCTFLQRQPLEGPWPQFFLVLLSTVVAGITCGARFHQRLKRLLDEMAPRQPIIIP